MFTASIASSAPYQLSKGRELSDQSQLNLAAVPDISEPTSCLLESPAYFEIASLVGVVWGSFRVELSAGMQVLWLIINNKFITLLTMGMPGKQKLQLLTLPQYIVNILTIFCSPLTSSAFSPELSLYFQCIWNPSCQLHTFERYLRATSKGIV